VIAFAVPVEDQRVERAVHAYFKAEGRHLAAGSAVEWFAVAPEIAREVVVAFATGGLDVDRTLVEVLRKPSGPRNRSSIRGIKEIKMTPARAAALVEVREFAGRGDDAKGLPGGKWGAAATALAVEQGISKDAALILMREWFASAERA